MKKLIQRYRIFKHNLENLSYLFRCLQSYFVNISSMSCILLYCKKAIRILNMERIVSAHSCILNIHCFRLFMQRKNTETYSLRRFVFLLKILPRRCCKSFLYKYLKEKIARIQELHDSITYRIIRGKCTRKVLTEIGEI